MGHLAFSCCLLSLRQEGTRNKKKDRGTEEGWKKREWEEKVASGLSLSLSLLLSLCISFTQAFCLHVYVYVLCLSCACTFLLLCSIYIHVSLCDVLHDIIFSMCGLCMVLLLSS